MFAAIYLAAICFGFFPDLVFARDSSPPVMAKELIEGCLAVRKAWPPYAISYKTELVCDWDTGNVTGEVYVGKKRYKNGKIDVLWKRYDIIGGKKKPAFAHRGIWTGSQYQWRQQSLEVPGQGTFVVASSKKQKAEQLLNAAITGGFLDGVLYGDEVAAIDILNKALHLTLQPKTEIIDGFACYRLSCQSEHGHYSLWVDVNHGFNIRKALVRKKAEDLIFGRKLRHCSLFGDTVVHEVIVELGAVEIKKVSTFYIPVAGTMTVTGICDDRIKRVERFVTKQPEVQFNPDFAAIGAFVMDGIAEGSNVVFVDVPELRYVWRNGRAIPASGK